MKNKKLRITLIAITATIFCLSSLSLLYSQPKSNNSKSNNEKQLLLAKANSVTKNKSSVTGNVITVGKKKKKATKRKMLLTIGIKTGIGFTTFYENMLGEQPTVHLYNTNANTSWNLNYTIGVAMMLQITPELSGELDLLYAVRGGTFRGINATTQVNYYTYNLNYLVVPAIARYHLIKKSPQFPLSLAAGGGLYLGYLLNSEIDVRVMDVGTDAIIVEEKGTVKERFYPLDTGGVLSILFQFDIVPDTLIVGIDSRYYTGFSNVRKNSPGSTYLNGSFEILGCLSFGLDLADLFKF